MELGASTREEGVVHFWARDNSPGIPSTVRTHLFTAFDHVGHVHHLEHDLGLSIGLQIVEKIGGQVSVEREPGTSSLFYRVGRVILPRTKVLTSTQKEVLILRFIFGFTTPEIALRLNKQPGAVHALQMRGLKRLAQHPAIQQQHAFDS